jgi:hypothetical protein
MATNIEMKYGDYTFSPVPLATISREYLSVHNREEPLGYSFVINLRGELYSEDGGIVELKDKAHELRQAFNQSGKLFLLKCNGNTVIETYPRIRSINFEESPNNWVMTIPYTIELEYDVDQLNEHPTNSDPEEWQFEFLQENKAFGWNLSLVVNQLPGLDYTTNDANNKYEARVTHNITAKGKPTWSGPGEIGTYTSAIDNALSWLRNVYSYSGYVPELNHSLSGWINLSDASGEYGLFDHYRSQTINEHEGTVSLSESWIVLNNNLPSGAQGITEEFSVSIKDSKDSPNVTVSIEGTIRGYEVRSYDTTGVQTNTIVPAFTQADNAFSVIRNRIFPRAQLIYERHYGPSTTLHPKAVNAAVGYQPSKGIITYSFEFDNRPCNFVPGSLSESFNIVDEHPSDVFAKIPVLGRPQGPVLQSINTVTESTREITIEAVMPLPASCSSINDLNLYKPDVTAIICAFESELTSAYDQVFKNKDTESWNPLTGRYSRSVSWTYQSCSVAPNTSFCS